MRPSHALAAAVLAALAATPPAMSPRTDIVPAGLPYCGGPSHICINGWVWECQCFSYGCQYMTTAWRCEDEEHRHRHHGSDRY